MKKKILLLLLVLFFAGCGSILSRTIPSKSHMGSRIHAYEGPYSGLVFDGTVIVLLTQTAISGPDPNLLIFPFVILDLPLSGVFDTILLPADVLRKIRESE